MPKSKPKRRSPTPRSRVTRTSRILQKNQGVLQKNEGEGNRTAARRYDSAVEKTVKSGLVPAKARAAARALDGPEGSELRRAEARAKRGKTASGSARLSK